MTQVLTYADKVNARYNHPSSFFVSLKKRIDTHESRIKSARGDLDTALKTFHKNNPNFHWNNLTLVQTGITATLDQIEIDDTMNRPLEWKHVCEILKNFKQTLIQPVNVYSDQSRNGKYIAWDGQHTSIVLYILARESKMIASQVTIPINFHPSSLKSEIRECFITLNSRKGKLPLSPLALFSNKVFGHKEDPSNKDWKSAYQKQQELASVGLFLTERSRGDSTEDGAITQVGYIDTESLTSVKNFCRYWKFRKEKEDSRVNPKELILVSMFLNLCQADKNISVTDTYVKNIVDIMWNRFECDFKIVKEKNTFFEQIEIAYENWYQEKYHKGRSYNSLTPVEIIQLPTPRLEMIKNSDTAGAQDLYYLAFLIKQLEKDGIVNLPSPPVVFDLADKDLFYDLADKDLF